MRQGYHSMKTRLEGGKTNPLRDKIHNHCYPCPGYIGHNIISEYRKVILFNKYSDLPQKTWRLYWRLHLSEYRVMPSLMK